MATGSGSFRPSGPCPSETTITVAGRGRGAAGRAGAPGSPRPRTTPPAPSSTARPAPSRSSTSSHPTDRGDVTAALTALWHPEPGGLVRVRCPPGGQPSAARCVTAEGDEPGEPPRLQSQPGRIDPRQPVRGELQGHLGEGPVAAGVDVVTTRVAAPRIDGEVAQGPGVVHPELRTRPFRHVPRADERQRGAAVLHRQRCEERGGHRRRGCGRRGRRHPGPRGGHGVTDAQTKPQQCGRCGRGQPADPCAHEPVYPATAGTRARTPPEPTASAATYPARHPPCARGSPRQTLTTTHTGSPDGRTTRAARSGAGIDPIAVNPRTSPQRCLRAPLLRWEISAGVAGRRLCWPRSRRRPELAAPRPEPARRGRRRPLPAPRPLRR